MNFLQIALIICATSLLVTAAVFTIIRTMPSRDGIGWWVLSSSLQFVIYFLRSLYFGVEETTASLTIFYVLQMSVIAAMSIGMLDFIDMTVSFRRRLAGLGLASIFMALVMLDGNEFYATCIFVAYMALISFHTAIIVWQCKEAIFLLKTSACILLVAGFNWLGFAVMGKVEWFVSISFLVSMALIMGLYFCLATIALMQFRKITNDSEEKAIRAAIHDPLTDLYNRSHLAVLYEKYKSQAKNGKGSFVLLYIDLDGFKAINDTYGHRAGDVILTVVAKRLQHWLGDKGDAIRIGGDELVVINTLRPDASSDMIFGTSTAQSILELLEKPIIDGKDSYNISGSIGGCYYKPNYNCVDDMLSKADELMYSAKKSGGHCIHFGEASEQSTSVKSRSSEPLLELRKAVVM